MLLSNGLEKCKAVVVSGKNKVTAVVEGLEAMLWYWYCQNHWNDKSMVYVFGEDERLIFTSSKSSGLPKKVPSEEKLFFKDIFTPV